MCGQIIIDDQRIIAFCHEAFGNAGGGIWGNVGKACCLIALSDYNDTLFEGIIFLQDIDRFGYSRRTLTNGAIDTVD